MFYNNNNNIIIIIIIIIIIVIIIIIIIIIIVILGCLPFTQTTRVEISCWGTDPLQSISTPAEQTEKRRKITSP